MGLLYDPPSGWRYGFPRPYKPLTPDEPVKDTLIRDGYPAKDAEWAAKHCRYLGNYEELKKLGFVRPEDMDGNTKPEEDTGG